MGSEARTRLALAGLLVVTLLAFSRVFQEGDYPGPALLGMLLAVGLAQLTRRVGLVVWASALVSMFALGWYLCLIFAGNLTFYGLPTPAAIAKIGTLVVDAYEKSSLDYAPVPLRPGYVLLTIAAMWLLAALGETATFRWRRPLIPAIASAAMFSFVLIVGIRKGSSFLTIVYLLGLLTYLGLESAHRLGSWGRWVSGWAKRWDSEVTTGPLARKMGASCLAAALIAPFFLPALGKGLLSWRSGIGGGAGGEIDTLVSLAPKLVKQSNDVLFEVQAPRPAYWRLVTLTYFDGNSWHPEPNRETLANGRVASDLPPPNPGAPLLQRYEIRGLEGEPLPAVPLPETVTMTGDDADVAMEFNPITADVEVADSVEEGMTYEVRSLVPNVTFRSMRRATIPQVKDVAESLGLPDYLPMNTYEVPRDFCPPEIPGNECPLQQSRIFRIAQRWTQGADRPFDKLLLLQNRFRGQFQHQLPGRSEVAESEVKPLASAEYLTRFLTETRTGYCQQFATAFAVLARMLGYPARVSVGFLPGETAIESPDQYIVRGNDAHAWPEVYFEDIGWIAFEPTPRGAAPPPAYTQAQAPGAGVNPPALDPGGRAARGQQNPRGIRDTLDARPGRTAERERREREELWHDSFVRLATTLGVVIALLLIVTPLAKLFLIRRRYRKARDGDALAGAAFAEFEQEASDLAYPRGHAETAGAYVKRLVRSHNVSPARASRLAELFEEAIYGPAGLSDRQGSEAVRLTHALKKDLWAEASWTLRAQRLFSPGVVVAELQANERPSNGDGSRPGGLARVLTRSASERR
ncbi:MAG TPA: DUF3488 and transglutaminase-like domain-containing protein [Actinomycetota bacterium]|nr:DUF3488 and transglutaminase-like domain-containing protein [Actinomycetota bacterium]